MTTHGYVQVVLDTPPVSQTTAHVDRQPALIGVQAACFLGMIRANTGELNGPRSSCWSCVQWATPSCSI